MPSIVVSLGIGLEFRLLDDAIKKLRARLLADGYDTAMGLFTSALGAHLTWTLPFGLLIMFAVFNRFDPRFEEAARDLGASPWQTLRHVVLPIIVPQRGRHRRCSASRCPGTRSRAPARRSATATRCRWSCRARPPPSPRR